MILRSQVVGYDSMESISAVPNTNEYHGCDLSAK